MLTFRWPSVWRSGYRYLALQREDLSAVVGEEPEFEAASRVAGSLDGLFKMLVVGHAALASWL